MSNDSTNTVTYGRSATNRAQTDETKEVLDYVRDTLKEFEANARATGVPANQARDEAIADFSATLRVGFYVAERVADAAVDLVEATPGANTLDDVATVRGRPYRDLLVEQSGLDADLVFLATGGTFF
jgi:hypothetical protein